MHVSKYKRSKYTLFMIQAKKNQQQFPNSWKWGCLTIGHFLILTSIFHINNFFIYVNFKKNLCCEKKMGGPAGPAPPPPPMLRACDIFIFYVFKLRILHYFIIFCCYLVIKKMLYFFEGWYQVMRNMYIISYHN